MPAQIYALMDPRTEEIRYIGKTSQTLRHRRMKHLTDARRRKGTYLLHWLRQLQNEGLEPDMLLLGTCAESRWREVERAWIAYGRAQGWPLTNSTEGGEGLCDPAPYVRRKLAEAARGKQYARGKRSDAFRRRMAQVAKETRNALGHEVSEEARQSISQSLKDYYADGGEAVRGEQNGQSKLTAKDVRFIRRRYATDNVSLRALARDHGVCHETIRKIVSRETWGHIN